MEKTLTSEYPIINKYITKSGEIHYYKTRKIQKVSRYNSKMKLTDEQITKLKECRAKWMPEPVIAKELGISLYYARKFIREMVKSGELPGRKMISLEANKNTKTQESNENTNTQESNENTNTQETDENKN